MVEADSQQASERSMSNLTTRRRQEKRFARWLAENSRTGQWLRRTFPRRTSKSVLGNGVEVLSFWVLDLEDLHGCILGRLMERGACDVALILALAFCICSSSYIPGSGV